MIRINIKHIFVLAGFIGSFLSCQDLKFGDDFLEKAPSNDVDIDVIYSNAQYARTALWSAYATLHYGLNLGNQGNQLMGSDPLDCLTDLVYSNVWTDGVSGAAIHYNGTYSADYENNGYSSKYSYYHYSFAIFAQPPSTFWQLAACSLAEPSPGLTAKIVLPKPYSHGLPQGIFSLLLP